jgi:beta-lactamase class A
VFLNRIGLKNLGAALLRSLSTMYTASLAPCSRVFQADSRRIGRQNFVGSRVVRIALFAGLVMSAQRSRAEGYGEVPAEVPWESGQEPVAPDTPEPAPDAVTSPDPDVPFELPPRTASPTPTMNPKPSRDSGYPDAPPQDVPMQKAPLPRNPPRLATPPPNPAPAPFHGGTPSRPSSLRSTPLEMIPAKPGVPKCAAGGNITATALKDSINHLLPELQSKFPDFAFTSNPKEQLGISVVNAANPAARASYRGDRWVFPASTVKLYYGTAYCHWLENRAKGKQKQDLLALEGDVINMIRESNNAATGRVFDKLTNTNSSVNNFSQRTGYDFASVVDPFIRTPRSFGAALPDETGPEAEERQAFVGEFKKWLSQRLEVERYFRAQGFGGMYLREKTWDNEPTTKADTLVRRLPTSQNAGFNLLQPDRIADLMMDLYRPEGQGKTKLQTTGCGKKLKSWLSRDKATSGNNLYQKTSFLGQGLPPGSKYSSKAGWTSKYYHDVAYIELPNNGPKYVLTTYTTELPAKDRKAFFAAVSKHFSQFFAAQAAACR